MVCFVEVGTRVCFLVHVISSNLKFLSCCRGSTPRKTDKVDDDDCFYYHSWRNNVVIACQCGSLSSFNRVFHL